MPLLSIIIPCFNEEDVISQTISRLQNTLNQLKHWDWEVVFVDDGSRDRTFGILQENAATESRIKIIRFSRNFGHQPAVAAGIENCSGDFAIILDADLQDPPELIPDIIAKQVETRANVVFCVRQNRQGVSALKNFSYKFFYRLVNRLSDVDLPLDSGDFRLIDRNVIEAFKSFHERNKYIRGIISWMGYTQVPFYYDRPGRQGGVTKYSLSKLLKLASTGMFYFSKKPLKIALFLGIFGIITGLLLTAMVIIQKLTGVLDTVPGWASLILTTIFFGGVQLVTIGVLGEYIGNIFDEVRSRPEYIVHQKVNFRH